MEVKEFPIATINRYPADDKHKYPQVVVEIMGNDGLIKGYATQGNWNKDWIAGGKGKAGIEMMTSKATGAPYAKLSCPPELKQQAFRGGVADGKSQAVLEKILSELVAIRCALQGNKPQQEATDEVPKDTSNDLPINTPKEEEVPISEIPF